MSNDIVAKVKSGLDIVDTIKKYVDLSKRGQNYLGLCPFHNEKTPSFNVSPTKKIFHCFGCGAGGDVLTFLMKYENLSFKEVLVSKAKELNIEYEGFKNNAKQNDLLDKVRSALTFLQGKYSESLHQESSCKKYCECRGLENQEITSYGIGYAPAPTLQSKWVDSLGENKKDILATGLFNDEYYPLLKNRLIFPIHNAQGIIVGFSGRDLGENSKAKYINSPESVIFSKKKLLYGMHLAKKQIKAKDAVIIVEGYFDVIAMAKNGFENTVGVMGTALTEYHAKQISRFCSSVILMFDNDNAGQNAIFKSIPALQKNKLKIEVVNLGEKDPADFFESHSQADMNNILSQSMPYIEYCFDAKSKSVDLSNPNQKSDLISGISDVLKTEQDRVVREHYVNYFSEILKVSRNILTSYLNGGSGSIQRANISLDTDSKYSKAEELILYFFISNIECRAKYLDSVKDELSFFQNEEILSVFKVSNFIDLEIINEINHSEIREYLLSLVIKFSEKNIQYNEKEMEEYVKLLFQNKTNKRIEEIKKILGTKEGQMDNEKKLLVELSSLIKKSKRGAYASN